MSAHKAPTPQTSSAETVLLIEDDGNDVLLTTFALQKVRPALPLRIVSDGEEAIFYLKGKGAYADREQYPLPTLVLLDIHLPRKSGFQVLEWIRQQAAFGQLPVILFSSSSRPADVHQAYDQGANSYLVKPVEFDEMVNMIQRFEAYWTEINRFPTAPASTKSPRPATSLL